MEDNIKTFLDKIQELQDSKLKVDIISTGKSQECKSLTFKQQKDIISTIAESPTHGALKFQKVINDIILSNTENNELLVVDRLPIIVKLRIDAMGNTVKYSDSEVLLDSLLPTLSSMTFDTTKTIKGVVNVDLEVPTLLQENKIIQTAIDGSKKGNDVDLGKTIGNIYTYEIMKYVKRIFFDQEEIIFTQIPIKDRYKIIENLPLSVNKEIISFIQKIKKVETTAMTVVIEGEEKYIDIDVSFFDS
jgi:hypothetical protein